LGADILRYGEQGKITVRDARGMGIRLGDPDNGYDYATNLLEKLMINLGMVKGGEELELSDEAAAILAKFEQDLTGTAAASSSASRPQISADRFSDAFGKLINELKQSADPKERKLAFALFAMSQNWIVQPAKEFGALTREVFGHERFQGHPTSDLKDLTHFDIKFEQDGGITLEARGVYVNKDMDQKGEDFTAHFTTTVRMSPTGDDKLGISYHVLLEHPPGRGMDPSITKLKDVLREQGISVDTRGVDRTPQKMAAAAHGLIGAIREKDLSEQGVFRVGGNLKVYEGFVNETLPKIHPGDTTRLNGELEKMSLANLTSALKFLIREKYHLVSGNDLTSAFLSAGAEDADPAVIRGLVNNLPREKREILMDLIQLSHTILAHTDENQMTPRNLAISLSPSLFPEADPMRFEAQQKAFIKLLEAFPRQ
jgi:hypothetical protein